MNLVAGIVFMLVSYAILYFVIKAAVRDGIMEVRQEIAGEGDAAEDGEHIAEVVCPECGRTHDMDYPKCPYCGHAY